MPPAQWDVDHVVRKQGPQLIRVPILNGKARGSTLALVLASKNDIADPKFLDWPVIRHAIEIECFGNAVGTRGHQHKPTDYRDKDRYDCAVYLSSDLRTECLWHFWEACQDAALKGVAVCVHCNNTFHRGPILACAIGKLAGQTREMMVRLMSAKRVIYLGHMTPFDQFPQREAKGPNFRNSKRR